MGLILHFKFNETTGTTFKDEVDAVDGYISGTPNDDSQWVDGKFNGGLYRDSTASNIARKPYDAKFNITVYTYAFWVKSQPPTVLSNVVSRVDTDVRAPVIYLNTDGTWRCSTRNPVNGWEDVIATGIVCDDTWHHIAAVCDGTDIQLYTDGQPDTFFADITDWLGGVCLDDLRIYAGNGGPGAIDDLRVYDNALSAAEILELQSPYAPVPIGFAATPAGTDQINLTWSDV